MITKSKKNTEYIAKVYIENFPSRIELYNLLDIFLEKNGYNNDHTTDNSDNKVVFSFKNPDIAFHYVKILNVEKINNSLYAKLKSNLYIDVKLPASSPNYMINSKKQKNKFPISSNRSVDMDKYLQNSKSVKSVIKRTIANVNIIDTSNNFSRSDPYKSNEEKSFIDYRSNKSKWIVKKDFCKYVDKASNCIQNYIPNYVSITPSDPPLLYNFRDIQKRKWVNKKGFM